MKCPYGKLLEVLSKPHTLGILYSFSLHSPWRFTQLQKQLGMQPKTLTVRLQELVEFGLLDRKAYNEIPPRVDYQLTQKGMDLRGLFDELHAWSDKYGDVERPKGKSRTFEQDS
jgi:DNA-binding HxlR family transcriptional regulator